MKSFLRIKRKKSPEIPQQSFHPEQHANIAAGPSGSRVQPNTRLEDEGDGVGQQIAFQDGMDEDPASFPASRTRIPGIVTGDDYRNDPPTESTRDKKGVDTGPVDVSRFAKKARKGTLLEGATDATEGFGPLKVVLGAIPAIYANREESAAAGNKIECLLPRIVALEERFNSRPSDVAEQRRRDALIQELNGIEGELRSSSERLKSRELTCHVGDDEGVFKLLEDLREALFHYQMAQRTAIDNQEFKRIDPGEAAVLNNFRYAKQAEYRHSDRSGCLKGTRGAILDEVELWACDFYKPPVYWLNGIAGTGKITIAQTIAERTFADGRLGASFFCSRDFEDRSNLKFIFPTLAVHLARTYAEFRSIFVPLVQSDPDIADESLCNQMDKLIIQPLEKAAISTVIVIDALDECKDEEPASAILSVLGQFVAKVPRVKFFVTGRPEPRIREGFRLPLLVKATDVFVLHEVELSQVNNDIQLFFKHSLSKLRGNQPGLDNWPTEDRLDLLCERAAGLFVFATATVRFIGQRNSNPKRQLDRLLQLPGSSVFEGKAKLRVNTTLDLLYMSILQDAFGDDDPENDHRVRSVLGAVTLGTNPLSPSAIATLLDFESEDVFPLLLSLHSLLALQEDINHPVRFFHKSFPDFIVDSTRCSDPRFLVCPADQHAELAICCLELMNRRLEQNICKLPARVANSEVNDLKERTKQYIDQALQYACRSWYKHLVCTTSAHAPNIAPVLNQFLEQKFLFWLEALSIIGAPREAVDALEVTAKWPGIQWRSPTLDLVSDCFRFVIAFFDVISISALHIYHSALPLSPIMSLVRKQYMQHAQHSGRVIRGLQICWDPIIAMHNCGFDNKAVGVDDDSWVVWSPCSRLIAAQEMRTVEVLDAVTLKRLHAFDAPLNGYTTQLSFSPDSRFLTRFGHEEHITWDLQTGGRFNTFPSRLDETDMYFISSTYSTDGKMVAVAYEAWSDNSIFITTYDLLSGTQTGTRRLSEGRVVTPIWSHGGCLRFCTVKPGYITIWEVTFTLTHAPAEIEVLPAPDEADMSDWCNLRFIPTLSRLTFTIRGTISIWDAKTSKLLQKGPTQHSDGPGSLSSDGRFLAFTSHPTVYVYIWKESLDDYVQHERFVFDTDYPHRTPLLSPNGESVIMSISQTMYLWHTKDPNPLHTIPTPDTRLRNHILRFSPDEKLVALAQQGEGTVRIVDLQHGHPRLIINTDMVVVSLGVTRNTVAVADRARVIIWNLPAWNLVSPVQVDVEDSVNIISFDYSPPRRYLGDCRHVLTSPDLSRIAIVGYYDGTWPPVVEIYDVLTERSLASAPATNLLDELWFTPDGREVWGLCGGSPVEGWKVVQDDESDSAELKPIGSTAHFLGGRFPWGSRSGYEIRDDGWVVGPTKELLFWLPRHWRSHQMNRTWSGRFLGLTHGGLSDAVILEFFG